MLKLGTERFRAAADMLAGTMGWSSLKRRTRGHDRLTRTEEVERTGEQTETRNIVKLDSKGVIRGVT